MALSNIKRFIRNALGWTTPRKLVVIESDDWGTIRMPSRKAYDQLAQMGLDLDSDDSKRYNLHDTLATREDLEALFEVLSSVKDKNGKPAVFTAMAVVANPDFEKIEASAFDTYFFEPFTATLDRYYGTADAFELWKEGIAQRVFVPEFHGREHLNVMAWMRALRAGDSQALAAFKQGLWGYNNPRSGGVPMYQAAFDLMHPGDVAYQKQVVEEGLDLFEQLFGYKATFFVPPNGLCNSALEETAAKKGIRYLFTSRRQPEPLGDGKAKNHFHYLGQKNTWGQRYIIRNCFFEPNQPGRDWVDQCLHDVDMAFKWKKPAIIGPHRVNFIGVHDKANRDHGLKQLSGLLEGIVDKWPDVEFITSTELGNLMNART